MLAGNSPGDGCDPHCANGGSLRTEADSAQALADLVQTLHRVDHTVHFRGVDVLIRMQHERCMRDVDQVKAPGSNITPARVVLYAWGILNFPSGSQCNESFRKASGGIEVLSVFRHDPACGMTNARA